MLEVMKDLHSMQQVVLHSAEQNAMSLYHRYFEIPEIWA
jgi:hypothetical protein